MLMDHYNLKINPVHFREYYNMDKTEAKMYARILVDGIIGYRNELSRFLQGTNIKLLIVLKNSFYIKRFIKLTF